MGNLDESSEETIDSQPFTLNVLRASVGLTTWSPYNPTSDSDFVLGVARMISSGIVSSVDDEEMSIEETEPHREIVFPHADGDDFVASATDESTEVEATSPLNISQPPHTRRRGIFSRFKKLFSCSNADSSTSVINHSENSISRVEVENVADIEVDTEEEEIPPQAIQEAVPVHSDEDDRSSFVDTHVVMTCLSDRVQTESKYIVSVHDFTGQSVFNVSRSGFLSFFSQ